MATTNQFVCPDCGFRIFNRRYPRCERCGKALPKELIYSTEELSAMFAQEEREAETRQREREAQRLAEKKRQAQINDNEDLNLSEALGEILGDALSDD